MSVRTGPEGLPIFDQFSEVGFVDCVMKIENPKQEGARLSFHLAASYQGERLGMNVSILRGIRAGFDRRMTIMANRTYLDGVRFTRSGTESDRLLAAIAQLYQSQRCARQMVESESFTAVALHHEEFDIQQETVKIKLSASQSHPVPYEGFFNIDLRGGLAFLNEKDPGFRDPLIHVLSANCRQQHCSGACTPLQ